MTLVLILLGVCFAGQCALAWWSDAAPWAPGSFWRAVTYSLSLAVFNGSWFYLSGVGAASHYGWNYLTGYIGPALAITLFFPFWRRLARIVKRENIGSISDFLSARYGKSRPLGTLAAAVAILASLPYLASQLRALAMAWAVVTRSPENPGIGMVVFGALLAGFAILFGARKPALTEHNAGLVRVVALDSILKLGVLFAITLIAVDLFWTRSAWTGLSAHFGALAKPARLDGGLFNSTLLVAATMFCAPRQFCIAFVELEDEKDLKLARWLLPLFLLLMALVVPPIAIAGQALYGSASPDSYALKLAAGAGPWMSALAFAGVASSISVVVALETVALASMVSNELVLPAAARLGWRVRKDADIGRVVLGIRHGAIILILGLSVLYYRAMIPGQALSTVNLVAAAGLAQLAPALFGGLLWRRGHAAGAIAGTAAGLAIWLYYIAAPQFLANIGMTNIDLHLAAATGTNQFVQKVLLTQIVNCGLYVAVSLWARPRMIDHIQAALFVGPARSRQASPRDPELTGTIGDLKALVAQFLGAEAAERSFAQLERRRGRRMRNSEPVDPSLLQGAERMLAGVIGASLARSVLGWQLSGARRAPADVVRILDDAAHSVQFNRGLMETALAHLSHGVYVTDRNGHLKVWNACYAELFGFPPGLLHVGMKISEAIRLVLRADGWKQADIDDYLRQKADCMRRGLPQNFEREHKSGRVLKVAGSPMPDGNYLTTISDVTDLHRATRALKRSNEILEQSVAQRTAQLTHANAELVAAKGDAERARNSQARFLAAASHDLLQPLQAARLFIGTLYEDGSQRDVVKSADICIETANRLLRALLNLSRLEIGGVKPEVKPVEVASLLTVLSREFEPIAADKKLRLKVRSRPLWVMSDPDLLRSVLQNLIGNAIRYTRTGTVFVGCRNDGGGLRFEVRDSGSGIPGDKLDEIFHEYSRLANDDEPGTGLGLAIADHICRLLGHRLRVASRPGQGSTFSVTVPLADRAEIVERPLTPLGGLGGLRLLYVENDSSILKSMASLLGRWGVEVCAVQSAAEALEQQGRWDVVLADYQLGEGQNGLDVIEALRGRANVFVLITASWSETLARKAASLGVEVIRKPVAPASLRSFLTHARQTHEAAE